MFITMLLLSAIKLAITCFAFAAVLTVYLLMFEAIISWFRARTYIKMADNDNIAFSLMDQVNTDSYTTIYGIYNTRTEEIKDAESVHSSKIDNNISSMHSTDKIMIYE